MESLETISEANPFVSSSCRADRRPLVDIIEPKRSVITTIERNLQEVIFTSEPRIVPILGSAGSGKTSLYHTISDLVNEKAFMVYLSPQTSETHADNLFTELWFALMAQLGIKYLHEVVINLKKLGSLEDIVTKFTGHFAVVAEMLFAFDDEKYQKTATYLFSGLKIENPILPTQLTGGNSFYDPELCFAALKMVLHFSQRPIIFFFDEIESLFVSYGDQPELRLFEKIKRIYNELNNTMIILSSLPGVWERIISLSTVSAVSRFETPTILRRFTLEDLEELVTEYLLIYWNERSLGGIKFPTSIWPFTDKELADIHLNSDGNPREALKFLRNLWYDSNEKIQAYLVAHLGEN